MRSVLVSSIFLCVVATAARGQEPPPGSAPTRPQDPAFALAMADTVARYYPGWARDWAAHQVYIWFLVSEQDSVVQTGTAPRPPRVTMVSSSLICSLVPGADTLTGPVAQIVNGGMMGPGSPPVIWVRMGARPEGHFHCH